MIVWCIIIYYSQNRQVVLWFMKGSKKECINYFDNNNTILYLHTIEFS